jgi:putative FmdB family regulatory protein
MPIYEYICEKCGSELEVIQKVGDAPLKKCPDCKGKLEKIVSRTSFQFKGSGWYVTDYARKSTSGDADKAGKVADKKAEGSDKKADTPSSASSGPGASETA